MNLPNNVRIKRFPWTVLPILSLNTAHALYPNIYLPRDIYHDLQTASPHPRNVSILIHEQTHIHRQKTMGWIIWGLRYCFSATFRFEEEIQAIVESMHYFKKHDLVWDTHKSATYLSSYLYLWCTKYHPAKKRLDEEWQKI